MSQPPRPRDQPLPAAARRQPGRLVSLGRGGAGARQRGGPADPPLDRLLGLPLVPRDGARVLREPGDRRLHERALRQRQGRSRGAPRPRRDLHGGGAGDHRPGRLADDRLPRPRRRPVLRRHLLPARREPRHAELPDGAGSGRRRLRAQTRGDPRARRRDPRPARRRSARSSRPPRPPEAGAARRGRRAAAARLPIGSAAASAARPSSRPPRRSSSCCATSRGRPRRRARPSRSSRPRSTR